MTPDFLLGQLRVALIAFLSYAAGKGWLTPADVDLIKTLAASLGPVAVIWAWSIYRNFNTKFVPRDAIALQPISSNSLVPGVLPNPGEHISMTTMKDGTGIVGKVV